MENYDVAVVGLGLMGSAATWALGRRGYRVAAFDTYAPGHRNGSSHGHGRIFRRVYPDPLYVELTGRAAELWDRLSAEAGEPLLDRIGGVTHGVGTEEMAALLRDAGVPSSLLGPDEAARRWPMFRFEGPALYDPQGGVLDPEKTIAALTRLGGATVAYDSPVRAMEPDADGVLIRTGTEVCRAATVVVAAGAWTGPLLGVPSLDVTQQQVFFFAARSPRPWPTLVHDTSIFIYGLPENGLIKLGEHAPGTPTTAATRDFQVDPAARERMVEYVGR